jgi:hypothetical protein
LQNNPVTALGWQLLAIVLGKALTDAIEGRKK